MSVSTLQPTASRTPTARPATTEAPPAAKATAAPAQPSPAGQPAAAADSFRAPASANPFAQRPATDVPDPAYMVRNQPAVQSGKEGVKRVEGDLFVDGPSVNDAKQGWAGDCYLIASMSALASVAPERIRDMMKPNADGSVTVRLFDKTKEGKLVPKEVTVDADFLVRNPKTSGADMVYASSAQAAASGKPELWVPLLEKAYAQLKGGYDQIAFGGDPLAALEALTGQKSLAHTIGLQPDRMEVALGERLATLFKVKPEDLTGPMVEARKKNAGQAWDVLKAATEGKEPMVACTYHEPELLERGLMPMHAYTVVGVEEKNGQKLVTLRNPAPYIKELEGNQEVREEMMKVPDFKMLADLLTSKGTTMSSLKYGTFTMPFDEFQRSFSNVSRTPLGAQN